MEHQDDKASRRSFLKAGVGMMGAMGLGSAPHAAMGPPSPPPSRPNFVFILGEGHRPDALSLNGNNIIQTPNFDRIGREGMQFSNSFCVNALCLPARSTALTGMYSHSTGCVDNAGRVIPANIPLFTELLRQAGYEVALFGKAHIGLLGERQWDHYFGFPGAATDYFWPALEEGANGKVQPSKVFEGYVDDVVTDRAVEWMKQKRDKPFCVCLWFQAPHTPFFRPRRYLDLYNGVAIPNPPACVCRHGQQNRRALCPGQRNAEQLRPLARGNRQGLLRRRHGDGRQRGQGLPGAHRPWPA